MNASTDIAQRQETGAELDNKRLQAGLAEGNGVINPARWQMLAAIAETVASTTFVPRGLRGDAKATLACLLYGDALGLQPMTSLKEVHVIDGTPGLSAAAMAALVRKGHPGHRMGRDELRDEHGNFQGVRAHAERGDTGETDEYTFTLAMAARAGLTGKDNWKKYPEAMCTARAYSQLCTFLFPDVFMGSPYVPEEIESFSDIENVVEAEGGENGSPIVKPPLIVGGVESGTPLPQTEAGKAAAAATAEQEQTEWEVANADTLECITTISADDRASIAASGLKLVRFPDVEGKFEIVGYEVDGATEKEKLLVRPATAEPGQAPKPPEGSPAAVVGETIPKVFEYVHKARERGDVDFIRGVLEAERASKNRGRLISTLEEILDTVEAAKLEETLAGDGTGADNPLLDAVDDDYVPIAEADAFAPLEDGDGDVDEVADGHDELDPEIPFGSATQRAKIVRLKALCAYMADQHPEQKAWRLEGVVASAAQQWGGTIEVLEDLDEHQLELVWTAAEKYASEGVAFLAITKTSDIAKLAEPQEQA